MTLRSFSMWAALICGALVLQTSTLPLIAYKGIGPDLILLIVVAVSFLCGPRIGFFVGFIAGLIQDLVTGTFFGTNIFSKMILGGFCGVFSTKIFKEQFFLPLFSAAGATVMNYLILAVLMLLLGYRFNPILQIQTMLIPMLCYNLMFAWPMYCLVRTVCAKTTEKNNDY